MFIDIAKLLFQKDTRDALKELVALIRKKPEWQADLITLNEKLGYTDEPRAGVLVQFLREVLLKKEWPPKRAGVAEFVIQELVDNAFHHGKPADGSSGAVRINATLTSSWVSCRITDDGPGFDLAQTLEQQARGEPSGLSQIRELASKLVQDGRNTVEVVVRNTLGAIEVMVIDGIQVVSMRGRLGAEFDLDAEFSRIEAALDPGAPLLIDLSDAQYVASKGLRLLALIHRRNQALGQQSVLVVTVDSAIAEIVRISRYDKIFDCVTSRPDGLAKLSGKPPA